MDSSTYRICSRGNGPLSVLFTGLLLLFTLGWNVKNFSKPSKEDILIDDIFKLGSMDLYNGRMSYSEIEVLGRVYATGIASKKIRTIKGFLEKSLEKKLGVKTVCFAYVDLDLYQPTKLTLEFLNTKLVVGGYIVIDDYGFFSTGVKTAVDEFDRNYPGQYLKKSIKTETSRFCILQRKK